MAGEYFEAKSKASLYKRFKRKENTVFIQPASKPLQKNVRKGYKMYYVIVDKKPKKKLFRVGDKLTKKEKRAFGIKIAELQY